MGNPVDPVTLREDPKSNTTGEDMWSVGAIGTSLVLFVGAARMNLGSDNWAVFEVTGVPRLAAILWAGIF
jgi:hypothetical protein